MTSVLAPVATALPQHMLACKNYTEQTHARTRGAHILRCFALGRLTGGACARWGTRFGSLAT